MVSYISPMKPWAAGLMNCGSIPRRDKMISLFYTLCRRTKLNQHLIQRKLKAICLELTLLKSEADHLPPLKVQVKNLWNYTPPTPSIHLHRMMLNETQREIYISTYRTLTTIWLVKYGTLGYTGNVAGIKPGSNMYIYIYCKDIS